MVVAIDGKVSINGKLYATGPMSRPIASNSKNRPYEYKKIYLIILKYWILIPFRINNINIKTIFY